MENFPGPREILGLLFKHKYKILAVFLLTVLASYAVLKKAPKYYAAKAIIMVNFGREFIPISEVSDMRLPAQSQEAIINTEIQLIAGRELADRVLTDVGMTKLYPTMVEKATPATRESAIQQFGEKLRVNNIRGSNLLEIEFRHADPQVASRALTVLVERLKERHLQVFSNVNSSFLEEQLKSYQAKLQESQRALARFTETHQLFSSEEQGNALLKQRSDLETQLMQETGRLSELRQRLNFLKTGPSAFASSSTELRNQLNLLRRKERELGQRYKDESATISTVKDDIVLVERQIKEQEDGLRTAESLKIESDIKPLDTRIAGLKQKIQQVDREIQAVGKGSAELQDLKREVAANESNYQIYLKKVEEARISENMDQRKMTNITVVQQPSVPVTPVVLNQQKILKGGLLAAIVLSLGVAFTFEYLPRTFSTPESVERKLGVPLLAALEHRKSKEA